MLNSYMLMKWKSWENSWMVRVVFIRYRRSKFMVEESVLRIFLSEGRLRLYCILFFFEILRIRYIIKLKVRNSNKLKKF